jgi:hypothetical protein
MNIQMWNQSRRESRPECRRKVRNPFLNHDHSKSETADWQQRRGEDPVCSEILQRFWTRCELIEERRLVAWAGPHIPTTRSGDSAVEKGCAIRIAILEMYSYGRDAAPCNDENEPALSPLLCARNFTLVCRMIHYGFYRGRGQTSKLRTFEVGGRGTDQYKLVYTDI